MAWRASWAKLEDVAVTAAKSTKTDSIDGRSMGRFLRMMELPSTRRPASAIGP